MIDKETQEIIDLLRQILEELKTIDRKLYNAQDINGCIRVRGQ